MALKRASAFTPLLSAFQDPAYAPWMTRRGLAVLHSLLGMGLVFVAVWLDDRTGRTAALGWTTWILIVICWLGTLLLQRRPVRLLRDNRVVPVPKTSRVLIPAFVLFEIGSFASMALPPMGEFPVHIAGFFLNLGILIWLTLSGLCFLVLQIPFSWKTWLGAVLFGGGCLFGLWITLLCVLFAGG